MEIAKGLGRLFYIINPNETVFEKLEDVPNPGYFNQVHHSSEDYNLTTALRQSAFQGWVAWVFYLPLAFFIPPPIFIIHQQFNLLYQFWIHTEVVDDLGPLEYVLNTAKHHRIHHGVLIIWDRIFGTFEKEKENEPIIYGLVEDIKSFNPFWLQYFYGQKLWDKVEDHKEMGDKISSVLKGPGWTRGKTRLGDPMDCPQYPKRQRHHIKIATWKNWYVVVHFLVVLIGFDYLSKNTLVLDQMTVLCSLGFVVYCLTSIGFMLEDRVVGIYSESLRSLIVLIAVNTFEFKYNRMIGHLLSLIFIISIIILNVNLLATSWGNTNNPKNDKENAQKLKLKQKNK